MERAVKPAAPKYSIGIKAPLPEPWNRHTPGPGAYRNMEGIGEPSPSMRTVFRASFTRGRPVPPSNNIVAGGPGTYMVPAEGLGPQILSTRPSTPRPTIATRTPRLERKTIDTLGPGSVVPRFVDRRSTPSFKFVGRRYEKFVHTPGPGTYDWYGDAFKARATAFSISGRNGRATTANDGGGPGRCREDSALGKQRTSTQKNYPAFSFGRRKPEIWKHPTPGPGAYGELY